MLHNLGDAWVSPLISHDMGKDVQTHRKGERLGNWFPLISNNTNRMRRSWEIGTHTFPIVWVIFSIRSHPMVNFITWEMHGFFHRIRKFSETHQMGKT